MVPFFAMLTYCDAIGRWELHSLFRPMILIVKLGKEFAAFDVTAASLYCT